MDWKSERRRFLSGRRCWKTAHRDWKIGSVCSGRRLSKKWGKKLQRNGFVKWSGSAAPNCSSTEIGCWITAGCELPALKRKSFDQEAASDLVQACKQPFPFELRTY